MYNDFFEFLCIWLGVRIQSMGYRGQYNRPNCVGIVLPQEDVEIKDIGDLFSAILVSHLDPNDDEDEKILNQAAKFFRGLNQDSMGLGVVYYNSSAIWSDEFKDWMDPEKE